jgi:alpha,alpha-trehalase
MMEKYDVMDTTRAAGGGEYPTQDGFGWTNGTALAFEAQEVSKLLPIHRTREDRTNPRPITTPPQRRWSRRAAAAVSSNR